MAKNKSDAFQHAIQISQEALLNCATSNSQKKMFLTLSQGDQKEVTHKRFNGAENWNEKISINIQFPRITFLH